MQQDIHAGFKNVNQAAAPEKLFSFLEAADRFEPIQTYKRHMRALSRLDTGQHVLEIGCGVGLELARLAYLVGPSGRAVGIDKSNIMLEEARRRALASGQFIEYALADASIPMPLPESSFDCCWTERVLMYVDEPRPVVENVVRALRPNGRAVFFEFDYATVQVDAPDAELAERTSRLVAESVPHPRMGRQLKRLLREMGMEDVEVYPHVLQVHLAIYRQVVGGTLEQACKAGKLSRAELDAWWSSITEADEDDRFLACFPGFIAHARKPSGAR